VITLCNRLIDGLTIVKLLGDDLYTVFEGYYLGRHVVIKIYSEKSDNTNEAEILEYLQNIGYVKSPRLYCQIHQDELMPILDELGWSITIPKELVQGKSPEMTYYQSLQHIPFIDSPYKIIVYEYLAGTSVDILLHDIVGEANYRPNLSLINTDVKDSVYSEIYAQIIELAKLNIVHGDVCSKNILQTVDGHYILIDYGRAIGIGPLTNRFPPNEYTISEKIIPAIENDISDLNVCAFSD
jgi:aminoglycoside phosphotransferase